jgi:flavin reductase (DIM6/NTAB) family NADH-FMN oxidoreductase RutF
MVKVLGKTSDSLFPLPVMLISCADKKGGRNLITLAWVSKVCAEPPMLAAAVRPSRHSHGMIKDSGEFVVNVPTEAVIRQVDYCGNTSGRNVDKFRETGLTPIPASRVKAPLIKECPVNFECVVRQSIQLGSHDLFIGEVVAVHMDDSILDADGKVDYAKAKPVVYAAPGYWSLARQIGTYGYSLKRHM